MRANIPPLKDEAPLLASLPPEIRREAILYLQQINGDEIYNRSAIETRFDGASVRTRTRRSEAFVAFLRSRRIALTPLPLCETIIWRAYLPGEISLFSYIARYSNGSDLPILEQYEKAWRLMAFDSLRILLAFRSPDMVLLGMRGTDSYFLAHWNHQGGDIASFEAIKGMVRQGRAETCWESPRRALQCYGPSDIIRACKEHDGRSTLPA